MKIVYILDTLARVGGTERIIAGKMNWLAENGYNVTLITAAQGQHPHSFSLSDKVRHVDIDARFHVQYSYRYPMRLYVRMKMNRRFLHNLKREIDRIDPDVIVTTTYYKADVVCRLKCRAAKVVESHSVRSFTGRNDGVRRNAIIQWFHELHLSGYNRVIEKHADVVVTLTEGDAREWQAARRVCVIPNMFVKTAVYDVAPCRNRALAVGRLVCQKGFDMLIAAWKTVAVYHPDWTLDLFGSGEEENGLRKQIEEAGLDGKVAIHPPTQHVFEEYARSDFFILTSRVEGFGLVLIEAMSCGTPCVSFDCPYGPADIIHDREDGILVENGNVERLAESICYMIEHKDERLAFGRKAAESVERYTPEAVMPQWVTLFESLSV